MSAKWKIRSTEKLSPPSKACLISRVLVRCWDVFSPDPRCLIFTSLRCSNWKWIQLPVTWNQLLCRKFCVLTEKKNAVTLLRAFRKKGQSSKIYMHKDRERFFWMHRLEWDETLSRASVLLTRHHFHCQTEVQTAVQIGNFSSWGRDVIFHVQNKRSKSQAAHV